MPNFQVAINFVRSALSSMVTVHWRWTLFSLNMPMADARRMRTEREMVIGGFIGTSIVIDQLQMELPIAVSYSKPNYSSPIFYCVEYPANQID